MSVECANADHCHALIVDDNKAEEEQEEDRPDSSDVDAGEDDVDHAADAMYQQLSYAETSCTLN